jgi:acyl-CoA thioester hydrolase
MEKVTADRVLLSVLEIAVRWSDMDANRHVNNALYFTYFEQARIDWLERVGMQDTAAGEGPVVVQTSCNFTRPIPYPEMLELRVYGGAPGRTSFRTYYEIVGTRDTGVKYADGEAVMVWVNRNTGKSCALPEALRSLLTQRTPQ